MLQSAEKHIMCGDIGCLIRPDLSTEMPILDRKLLATLLALKEAGHTVTYVTQCNIFTHPEPPHQIALNDVLYKTEDGLLPEWTNIRMLPRHLTYADILVDTQGGINVKQYGLQIETVLKPERAAENLQRIFIIPFYKWNRHKNALRPPGP